MSILNFLRSLFSAKTKEPINLSNYPKTNVDYGTLSFDQGQILDQIIAAIWQGKEEITIPKISQEDFDVIAIHLSLYFGNRDSGLNTIQKTRNADPTLSSVVLSLDKCEKACQDKVKLDQLVDRLLSSVKEGTIQDKLKQISKIIANESKYAYGSSNPLNLSKGAMCGAYSMLFYKMATRLGIKTYLCFGYANNGRTTGAHAWNAVECDGSLYFYDITFYDTSGRPSKFLHSVNSWEREYMLNNERILICQGGKE